MTGFPLNDQLFQMIIRRYSDEHANMDFDNYIGCLVRLDAMCRKLILESFYKGKNILFLGLAEWISFRLEYK